MKKAILAVILAAGIGTYGGIRFSDEPVPNLRVLGNASYAFRTPGFTQMNVGADSVGVIKFYQDAAGDTSIIAIFKQRTLSLSPMPTHSMRVTRSDDSTHVDEWVTRHPAFPEFTRVGYRITLYQEQADTLFRYAVINTTEACLGDSSRINAEYEYR